MKPGKRYRGQTLLWMVESTEGLVTYLFGTMHVGSRVAFSYSNAALACMRRCRVFAAEMHLGEVDPVMMQEAIRLAPEQYVSRHFAPRKFQKIKKILRKAFNINLDHWQHQHPFMTISMLAERSMPRDYPQALDEYLWDQAEQLGMERLGLERFSDQLAVMKYISPEEQTRQLAQVARNPARFRRQIRQLVTMYQQQDIRALYRHSKRQLQNLRGLMLYNRNIFMAERIEALQSEGGLFAAFGAAHLAGDRGVVALLKKKGFKVKPMDLSSIVLDQKESPI